MCLSGASAIEVERTHTGGGLAFYPDGSAQIFKEPIEAGLSNLSEFVKDYSLVRSKIVIAHVRQMSAGARAYENTHPCGRWNSQEYFIIDDNGEQAKCPNCNHWIYVDECEQGEISNVNRRI